MATNYRVSQFVSSENPREDDQIREAILGTVDVENMADMVALAKQYDPAIDPTADLEYVHNGYAVRGIDLDLEGYREHHSIYFTITLDNR